MRSRRSSNSAPSRTAPPLTWRRKLAFATFVVGAFFLGVELLARLASPAGEASLHDAHATLITTLGLPALNDTMEFDAERFWRLKSDVRDVRVTGAIRGARLDFRVSTHGPFRQPAPVGPKTRPRVLVLGDSCAFGLGVDDDETWPVRLQEACDAAELDVEIVNGGVPGYSAFQGRKRLERDGPTLRPDVVIAAFGFNDADSWSSRSDLETARQIDRSTRDSFLAGSRAYSALKRLVASLRAGGDATPDRPRPRLSPDEFLGELAAMHRLAGECDARLALVVWPFEDQVRAKSIAHEDYQRLVAAYCREHDVPCIDLLPAFVAADEPMFVDHIHASAAGCRTAARVAAPVVQRLFADAPSASGGT